MGELQLEDASVDLTTGTFRRNGESGQLPDHEHRLLTFLAARPMQTVSREELLEEVWGYSRATLTRTIDTTVRRLRAQLEADPSRPRHLVTDYGTGYRFVPLSTGTRPDDRLTLGDCTVLLARLTATWSDGTAHALSAQETALLRVLAENQGQPTSRSVLMREVWQRRDGRSPRAVDNAVMRLRAKIEADAARPRFLQTVRGAGYRLRLETAPSPTATTRPLPPLRTRLLGRDDALRTLHDLLAAPGLVTVHGTGGLGKTSLALQIAHQHPDAWFCDLSSATTAADLVRGVAAGLALSELPSSTAAQQRALGAHLARLGPTLLVLDNLEQVLDTAQQVLPGWLDQAPKLTILTTSRRPLRLPRERVFPLTPLAPDDAVRLFEARYTAAGGTLQPDDTPTVRALVTQLDHLPLAIELACGRARMMRPQAMLERMDRRLSLLRRSGPVSRHATMEAAIAWSWDQLPAPTQAALAWCSIFRDSFSLEAAEEVLPDDLDVIAHLDLLLDHALLHTHVSAAFPGEIRFRLMASIQAFAAARLREDRSRATRRHASYYASLAEGLLEDRLLSGMPETTARLWLEQPSFREAADSSDPDHAAWCVAAVHAARNDLSLLPITQRLRAATAGPLRARMARCEGSLCIDRGLLAEAIDAFRAGLTDASGDVALEAQLHGALAAALNFSDRHDEALHTFREGAALAGQCGARGLQAMQQVYAATSMFHQGRTDGYDRLSDALRTIGTEGFARARGFVLGQVGQFELGRGHYGTGIHQLQGALDAMALLNDPSQTGLLRSALSLGLLLDGQIEAAAREVARLPLHSRRLHPIRRGFILLQRGQYAVLAEGWAAAEVHFREAEPLLLGPHRFIPPLWLSLCDAAAGRADESAHRLAEARSLPACTPYTHPDIFALFPLWRALLLAPPDARPAAIAACRSGLAAAQQARAPRGLRLFDIPMEGRLLQQGITQTIAALSGPAPAGTPPPRG